MNKRRLNSNFQKLISELQNSDSIYFLYFKYLRILLIKADSEFKKNTEKPLVKILFQSLLVYIDILSKGFRR